MFKNFAWLEHVQLRYKELSMYSFKYKKYKKIKIKTYLKFNSPTVG